MSYNDLYGSEHDEREAVCLWETDIPPRVIHQRCEYAELVERMYDTTPSLSHRYFGSTVSQKSRRDCVAETRDKCGPCKRSIRITQRWAVCLRIKRPAWSLCCFELLLGE